MMFGLDDKHINFIKNMLKKHIQSPNAKFYIFGSRAKGKYREYSDIDIAIDFPDMLLEQKIKLQSDFENSAFPYEVDIIDLNTIQKDFKDIIKDDLVEFNLNN